MKLSTSFAALATATLLLAGCASPGYKEGNKAASSIQSATEGIAALQGHINQTLVALNALVDSPQADLRPQFKELQSKIDGLESAGKDVAKQRVRVGEQTQKYLADWDSELAQMLNSDIKSRSQSRKEEVARQVDAMKRSYSEFDMALRPFLTDLQDVRKYLSVDLTRGGIAAIKEPAVKAANDATPLRDSIAKLSADFKALAASISSVSPPPPK